MEKENNGRSITMMTNTMKQNVFRMLRRTYSIWDVGVIWSVLRKKWCLLTEWRDIQRVTETECVQSIEADIFHLRRWLIEVSPDIHPPFKEVTTQHYWQYVAKRDGVKFRKPNFLSCSGEFLMKFHDTFWGMNIVCQLPGVVFYSESFPFDQVVQFPIDHPAV